MKLMTKILVFLAVLIFSAVMASGSVNADNYVSLNAHQMDSDDYLILEFDFTQGDSVYVDIDIQTIYSGELHKVIVRLMPQASLGPIMTGGTLWHYNGYASGIVANYDKTFIMDSDDWPYQTYYFVVMTGYINTVWLDVELSVLVDYDGDGLYGSEDSTPLVNDDWLANLEDRITGIESNLTLRNQWVMENITALSSDLSDKYRWTMENITALSTALDEFKDNTSDEFSNLRIELDREISILRDDLDQEVSILLTGLEDLRVEMLAQDSELRNDLEDNVTVLRENITVLQSLLATLETQIYEVCDSMNETTMSMGLELEAEIAALSEALNTTDGWLQEVEDGFQSDLENVSAEVDLLESWAFVSSTRLNNVDANLSLLYGAMYTVEKDLVELDNREFRNNDARVLEAQKAQEDIEDALAEAKTARMAGVVMGLVGIILAIVAIVGVARVKSGDGT